MSSWQFTPIALLYLAAVIISLGISLNAWRLRPARGAYTFSVMALSTGIWSLGYLLGFFNTDPAWKMIMEVCKNKIPFLKWSGRIGRQKG